MSDIIPKGRQTVADSQTQRLTPETYKVLRENPSLMLPLSMREPVFGAWAMISHLNGMDRPFTFCLWFSVWIGTHGLSEEDAIEILRSMTSPTATKEFKFASDVSAWLSAQVDRAIAKRSHLAKQRAEREAAQAAERERLKLIEQGKELPKLSQFFEGIGAKP